MMTAEVLGHALLELAERHLTTPCQGRHRDRWTSDDAEQREWAANCCRLCPVLVECKAAGVEHDEMHHVWGGRDCTRTTKARTSA